MLKADFVTHLLKLILHVRILESMKEMIFYKQKVILFLKAGCY
jgi:hypothetical protein